MKSLEICEPVSGRGRVYRRAGGYVAAVDFDLEIWRNYVRVNGETRPSFDYVAGVLMGLDNISLMTDLLTLHLDDARRLDFFIYDSQGHIVADGGIYIATAVKLGNFSKS